MGNNLRYNKVFLDKFVIVFFCKCIIKLFYSLFVYVYLGFLVFRNVLVLVNFCLLLLI